jgi:hypothetical protein
MNNLSLTKDELRRILISQGKRCAACDLDISAKGTHAYNKTAKVYLCRSCNLLVPHLARKTAEVIYKLMKLSRQ